MTNPTSTPNQRVRFEEITPTNEIVAYFNTQLSDLVAGRGLPILLGYDDLDDIQFSFIELPSGNIVVLGQYENAPEIGVDLYVELNLTQNPSATADKIPDLVIETCKYLAIPRSTAIWFHPDYERAIDKSYPSNGEISNFSELLRKEIHLDKEREPFASAFREEIDCFYYALDIYPREKIPEYWAMLQHNLGLAYYHRTEGERWRNLQESIDCFTRSLEVFNEDEFPQKWQINREDLYRSIAELTVEKQNLIRDILERPDRSRDLRGSNLSGADLRATNLSYANLFGTNLINANLSYANLFGTNLINANLSYANLSYANLINANLIDANLIGAYLVNANLIGAYLVNAKLIDADLSNADLRCTNFRGTDLSSADLSDANVENTVFGFNKGIAKSMRQDLMLRGAIFEDLPGDRSSSLTPVNR
jgi:uncharacterized protein YjbI with pentapeptide repeats